MKNLIRSILLTLFSLQLSAQSSGKITYTETIKLDIKIEGMDESMLDMIPKSQNSEKELIYNSTESLYQNKTEEIGEDIDISSDDGSFQITIMTDDIHSMHYKNMSKNKMVKLDGIMGKEFLIEDDLPKLKWKITNEKIKYLDYECQKAIIENADDFVVAWFTSELPSQAGPADYHGLPGTILLLSVNEDEREIKATAIVLEEVKIEIPNSRKKVSQSEFEEIRIAKEKEMIEMYKSKSTRN